MSLKTILITGATAGIGEECAKLLATNNYRIVICGRRKERLLAVQKAIESRQNQGVYILNFDIRNQSEVSQAIKSLPPEWQKIDILINNAGLASGLNPIDKGLLSDWEKMIDTNMKGLLYISKEIIPNMVERQFGQIINIGSIAGKEVYPNGNVYCATKHAVDALTKAMREDLLPHGIKVTQIAPGMVKTEFSEVRFHGDIERAEKVYTGFSPLLASDIAEAVLFVISRPAHVNINDMIIMPTDQASAGNIKKS